MPFITQGKTNWKFLLIVIILAVIVGGGALWFSVKQEPPYQPSEIKKPEIKVTEEKTELTENEIVFIFKEIFPEGKTDSDLDEISDIKERALKYFQPFSIPTGYWKSIVNGRYKFVELNGKPEKELVVINYFLEKEGPPSGTDTDIYIFYWDNQKWNPTEDIVFGWRSDLQTLDTQTNGFKDLLYSHSLGAGDYVVSLYKWNGNEYIEGESIECDIQNKSEICNLKGTPIYWYITD